MSEYVTHCELTVNGQTVDDFKTVEEKEVDHYKQINLMGKTGHGRLTPRYGVTVEYVHPEGVPFNWRLVKNGTLSYTTDSGRKVIFSGVFILKEGNKKIDGENETTQTIELGAEGRIEN
jgi:hypothetical protein